jgi:putative nucleotide binding protein
LKIEIQKDEYWKNFVQNRGDRSTIRKYEEYAYVLDFNPRGKSSTVKGRDGIIIIAIGENNLRLLEILGVPHSTFDVGERIYIGKEGRTKVLSVLGKLEYEHISSSAQQELPDIFQKIIECTKPKIVDWINKGKSLTPSQIEKLITIIIKNEQDLSQGIIRKVFRIDL